MNYLLWQIAFTYDIRTDVCRSLDIGALVNRTTSPNTKLKVLQTSNIVALANMSWQQFLPEHTSSSTRHNWTNGFLLDENLIRGYAIIVQKFQQVA